MNTLEHGQKRVQMKIIGGGARENFGFEVFPFWGESGGLGLGGGFGEEADRHTGDSPRGRESIRWVYRQHLKRTPLFHPGRVICTKAFQPPRIICSALTPYCNEKQIPL